MGYGVRLVFGKDPADCAGVANIAMDKGITLRTGHFVQRFGRRRIGQSIQDDNAMALLQKAPDQRIPDKSRPARHQN